MKAKTKYVAKVECGDISITIHGSSETTTMKEFFSNVSDAWKALVKTESGSEEKEVSVTTNITKFPKKEQEEPQLKVQPKQDEGFKIRERIPNNIVDPSTLSFKKAVQEEAMIRCPICGQCHAAYASIGNDYYLLRKNFVTGAYDTVFKCDTEEELKNSMCTDKTDKVLYFYDICNAKQDPDLINTDLAVNNDTPIICPVCGETSVFVDWKKAHENPLDYFETETPCDICGGERIPLMDKDELEKIKQNLHETGQIYQCETCGMRYDEKGMPLTLKKS